MKPTRFIKKRIFTDFKSLDLVEQVSLHWFQVQDQIENQKVGSSLCTLNHSNTKQASEAYIIDTRRGNVEPNSYHSLKDDQQNILKHHGWRKESITG